MYIAIVSSALLHLQRQYALTKEKEKEKEIRKSKLALKLELEPHKF